MRRHLNLAPVIAVLAALSISACSGNSVTGPTVASVTVTPATGTLSSIGETVHLSAAVKDNSGKAVTGASVAWSTANDGVATVSSTGLVTAVGNGTVEISATASGIEGTAQVTVAQKAATVTVDPATLQIEFGTTGQLSASAVDAKGNAVGEATATWSSADESVATVDSTGMVTGVAAGTAVVTATVGSASGTADVTVTGPVPFAPSQDTTISGNLSVGEVDIPQGVTVTLQGDVNLTANGPVTIAGTVTGDCTSATVNGQADVTVSGSVTTTCSAPSPDDSLPVLTIMSAATLALDGATITSGGDLVVGNPGAAAAASAASGGRAAAPGSAGCQVSGSTSLKAANGSSSETPGIDGQRGGDVQLSCAGAPDLSGLSVDAGRGGDGASQEVTGGSATAVGSAGGRGGSVTVTAGGDHISVVAGGQMEIVAGLGGGGGFASAVSQDPTVKATATGGAGGDAGTLDVNVPLMGEGQAYQVFVGLGLGGDGGEGAAAAANGTDTHFDGGDAEGRGGKGGDAPALIPAAFSFSTTKFYFYLHPQGGKGGSGSAEFGSGKAGTADHRDGGNAGSLTATGGPGGSVMDTSGTPGFGGTVHFNTNRGGNGFNGCAGLTAGGNGGKGGAMAGSAGVGGFFADGTTKTDGGDLFYDEVALGGNGGDGLPPGSGGAAGADNVLENGLVTGKDSSFKPGGDGKSCLPSLSGLTDLTVDVGQAAQETFKIDGTSPLTVTATSSKQTVLPDANITGQGKCTTAGNCTLTVTAAAAGVATVTVTVTDPRGQSASGTFTVTARTAAIVVLGVHLAPPGMTDLEAAILLFGPSAGGAAGAAHAASSASGSDPFANLTGGILATFAGAEGYVVSDLTDGTVVRNELGNGVGPFFGAVPISADPPGPNSSAGIFAFGPNGAFIRSYDPAAGDFSAFAFSFQTGKTDVSNAGGALTGGEQVFVDASGVGFVGLNPANGSYEPTAETISIPGGEQVSAFEQTAGGPVLVITRDPTMGSLFFAPRDGSAPTFVGPVGRDARRIRCREGICAVTSFAGDSLTIISWDGVTMPTIVGDVAVGDGPVDLDLATLANGDVLVGSTGFNDNTWTLTEIAPDGSVVSNTTQAVDAGCTSPGHLAFFTDADGLKALVTCFDSANYDVLSVP